MALPPKIVKWLNERGITNAVIAANNLGWNGHQIVIPIKDARGNFLFNKYRRDPFGPEDAPKYMYDKGSTAQLFNAHKIYGAHQVIICEGEADAMRLQVEGWIGVTGTGGAGTFKNEWLEFFGQNMDIYICMDNDESGIKGATKLLTKLPAKLIMIPAEEGIKDITDFLQKYGPLTFSELIDKAEAFTILSQALPEFKTIADIENQITIYKHFMLKMLSREREAKNASEPYRHYEAIRQLIHNGIKNLEREIRKKRYLNKKPDNGNERITDEDILKAREVPIENFLQINHAGFAHCPFHGDKTPSLKVYKEKNKWFCFSCSEGSDVIDLIKKQDNCNFIEAVRKLLNK